MSQESKEIFKAINNAMKNIEAVKKDKQNKDQGFKYRSIDDFYNAAHPAFSEAGVFCVPKVLSRERTERETKNGGKWSHILLSMEFTFYAMDGSSVTVGPIFSEGLDSSDKGTNKAMSQAQKYALIQMLFIPTADMQTGDESTISGDQFVSRQEPSRSIDTVLPPVTQGIAAAPAISNPGVKNEAPADKQQLSRISSLLEARHIGTNVFQAYIKAVYDGITSRTMKRYQADAIIDLLSGEDVTEALLMSFVVQYQTKETRPASN